jgi:KDO2-lipid IV(A) lauroyltransferase
MKIGGSKKPAPGWKHWLLLALYEAARPFPPWVVYRIFCSLAATVAVFIPSFWRPAVSNMRVATRTKGFFAPYVGVKNAGLVQFNASRTWADHVFLPRLDLGKFASRVGVDGLENLREAEKSGRGGLVVSAHFTRLFLIVHKLAAEGFNLYCPTENLANPTLNGLVNSLRNSKGVVEFAPLSASTGREMLRRLRDGKIVVVLIDRDIQGKGKRVPFLGRLAKMPMGAAKIARQRNCFVVPATWEEVGANKFTAVIHPPIDPEKFGEDEVRLARAMLAPIEEQILDRPEQWVALDYVWGDEES